MIWSFACSQAGRQRETQVHRVALGHRLMAVAAVLALHCAAGPVAADVRVVTTTPTFADIVQQIGGKYVKVQSIMRGPESPHNVKAKPSHMMKLKRADLFVHSGLDGEAWAPQLIKGSRNRKLLAGQPGNVDVSRGIQLKQVPQKGGLSRALGDIHVFGNTHYALDPLNGIIIARTITDALKRTDSKHAEVYESNYQAYAKRLRVLTDRLVEKMAPYRGTRVVTYHRSWPYFLDRFGLVKVAEIEPKPGISPGPQHLSRCIATMKSQNARVVIVETFNSLKNSEFVAGRADGKAVVLVQNVHAAAGVDTYEQMFEHNIDALLAAFKTLGIEPNAAASAASAAENAPVTPPQP